ncbi:MAG: hypothetical protein U0528_17155 [Anaerolineae bacterium]
MARPQDGNGDSLAQCDIGAVEVNAPPTSTPTSTSTPTDLPDRNANSNLDAAD